MEKNFSGKYEIFYYISTLANSYTPAKTIFVCVPDRDAQSYESVKKYASNSGWLELAEHDGAVLVMPIAKNGWQAQSSTIIAEIYSETRKNFKSINDYQEWMG